MAVKDILDKTIANGTTFDAFLLLSSASAKTTASGKPYLSATLTDKTGSIDGKLWDYAPTGPEDDMAQYVGDVVKIRAKTDEYNGKSQLSIQQMRPTREGDTFELSNLIPMAPIDVGQAWAELTAILSTIADTDYRGIVDTVLAEYGTAIKDFPAAKSVHHAFVHGLLMHTGNMLRIADFMAGIYPFVDRDLLLTGTFLHDIGKLGELVTTKYGLVAEYSTAGRLLGHLVMGAEHIHKMQEEYGFNQEKCILLEHMLLSHHGLPEFGAAVRPQTVEAELLSQIDMLDARMELIREILEKTPKGEWSETSRYLDGRSIFNH